MRSKGKIQHVDTRIFDSNTQILKINHLKNFSKDKLVYENTDFYLKLKEIRIISSIDKSISQIESANIEKDDSIQTFFPIEYSVGIANNPKDLMGIYKLRKQVYVDELKYCESMSDYLMDEEDFYSTNFYIKYNGKIIGTARLTDERKGELELSKDINWKPYVRKDRNYCEITRLIFHPEHRKLLGTFLVFKAINDFCITNNINAIVIRAKAEPVWKRYYRNIGFNVVENIQFNVQGFANSPQYGICYRYFDNELTNVKFVNAIKIHLTEKGDPYHISNYAMKII